MTCQTSLERLVTADPGLPRESPTQAFWQHKPHAQANRRSSTLPQKTDLAVIGSGITAVAFTKRVLEQSKNLKVTVLEARTLCSGATGRNGGQLAINAAETYGELKESLGAEMAGKVIRFTIRTVDRIREIIREFDAVDEAQLNEVRKLRACMDNETWKKLKTGADLLEADHPSLKGLYEGISRQVCEKEYGVYGAIGALLLPAATLWPYRLVCLIFESLLDRYPTRLNLETGTPVTSLTYDIAGCEEYPYLLSTRRGPLRAKKIIHCTNGYTGHLLPNLRGPLTPMLGTMSVQDLGHGVSNKGEDVSWAVHQTPKLDPSLGTFNDGLQYLAQNARTKFYFHGGDDCRLADTLHADDSKLISSSVKMLTTSLPKLFNCPVASAEVISSWSGVMCFSADGLPVVGQLSVSVTGRQGGEEWISAAYNGYGMPNAFGCGEFLADQVLGHAPDPDFPEAYVITERRLRSTLKTSKLVELLRPAHVTERGLL